MLTLSSICEYVKEKTKIEDLNELNYISTENMLPDKMGIEPAASLPNISYTQSFILGDVLVSNIRPYFKKIWRASFSGGCSNDVLVFRATGSCDPIFLYYVLSSDSFFEYSTATSKGTKMPRGDKKAIMDFAVPDVDRSTQRKIASILSALDDKIAINQKFNANLQAQAAAVFKSWFVDFEPWGGVMPEDWKKGNLLDIADYLNGLAMQKYPPLNEKDALPVLKIKELRQGFTDISSDMCSRKIGDEYIIHDGDMIFSWSGSLLVDFWCGGDCGINQHLFKVSSQNYDKWFYYHWTLHHLKKFIEIAADKATTMGHIKRDELTKAEVFIPSAHCYKEASQILGPLCDGIITYRIENRHLAAIRDALLPRLMSGEIDVSEIEL